MNNFISIYKNSKIELEIKKSKFIGLTFFVDTEFEAQQIITKHFNMFSDATHVCYAYVLNNIEKCSDNGEPSGTAGKPMLEVIKKLELKNVLVIVVRYFGGIKLGAGGLNRAYSDCAKNALISSGKAEYCLCDNFRFMFKLGIEDKMFNKFYLNQVTVIKKQYSNFAIYEVSVIKEHSQKLLEEISATIKRNDFYLKICENYLKKEI